MKHYGILVNSEMVAEYNSLQYAKKRYREVIDEMSGTGVCVELDDNFKECDEIILEHVC